MNDELKLCPFCGSRAIYWEKEYFGMKTGVRCSNPQCQAERGFIHSSKTDAIKFWNERVGEGKNESVNCRHHFGKGSSTS